MNDTKQRKVRETGTTQLQPYGNLNNTNVCLFRVLATVQVVASNCPCHLQNTFSIDIQLRQDPDCMYSQAGHAKLI